MIVSRGCFFSSSRHCSWYASACANSSSVRWRRGGVLGDRMLARRLRPLGGAERDDQHRDRDDDDDDDGKEHAAHPTATAPRTPVGAGITRSGDPASPIWRSGSPLRRVCAMGELGWEIVPDELRLLRPRRRGLRDAGRRLGEGYRLCRRRRRPTAAPARTSSASPGSREVCAWCETPMVEEEAAESTGWAYFADELGELHPCCPAVSPSASGSRAGSGSAALC